MEVKRLLMSGGSFESLAMKYSEDPSTANKGGVLPWFGTGKMVEDFEDAAFAMTEVGDIAGPSSDGLRLPPHQVAQQKDAADA